MTAVVVLGALLGLALLQVRWLAFPPAPDLIGEIEDWRRGRERATQRAAGGPAPVSPIGRLTRWVVETVDHYRPSGSPASPQTWPSPNASYTAGWRE